MGHLIGFLPLDHALSLFSFTFRPMTPHDNREHLENLSTECSDSSASEYYGDFRTRCETKIRELTGEQRQLLKQWLELGRNNPWISQAVDPPFSILSFHFCRDVRELTERLLHGNSCLGQAFALGDICFINQVNGGDEWLTIKGQTPFESITMQTRGESFEAARERLLRTIEGIQRATELQCRCLEYGTSS